MKKRKRMLADERRRDICEKTKEVFLEKGYLATTIDDILAASELSKGGLYHHYRNKTEILEELIQIGNEERFSSFEPVMTALYGLEQEDLFAELTYLKIMDENDYKKLWAIVLVESRNDDELSQMAEDIIQRSKDGFLDAIVAHGLDDMAYFANEDFTAFINAMIVSVELLGTRAIFERHPEFIKETTKTYLHMRKKEGESKK